MGSQTQRKKSKSSSRRSSMPNTSSQRFPTPLDSVNQLGEGDNGPRVDASPGERSVELGPQLSNQPFLQQEQQTPGQLPPTDVFGELHVAALDEDSFYSATDHPSKTPARVNQRPLETNYSSPDANPLGVKQTDKIIDELQKENFGLKLKLYFMEENIQKLSVQSDALDIQNENVELRVMNHSLKTQLEKNIMDLTSPSHDNDAMINILKRDNEHLEIELSDSIALINQQTEEIVEKDKNLNEFAELIQVLESNNDSLVEKVDSLQERSALERNELNAKIEQYSQKLEIESKKNANLITTNMELQLKLNTIQRDNPASDDSQSESKQMLDSYTEMIKELKKTLSDTEEAVVKPLKLKVKAHETKIVFCQSQIQELKQSLQDSKSLCTETGVLLSTVTEKYESLDAKLKEEMKRFGNERKQLSDQLEEKNALIEKMKTSMDSDMLQLTPTSRQRSDENVSGLYKECVQLRDQIEFKTQTIASLTNQLKEQDVLINESNQKNATRVSELRKQNETLTTYIQELKQEHATSQEQVKKISLVLDLKSKQDEAILTLQNSLSEKEVQLQYVSQDRAELKSQLQSSMETISTLKNEIQKQYQTLTYQDGQNKKLFEEKYQEMVLELNTKEGLVIKLQENLNKMKDVVDNTKNLAIHDTETYRNEISELNEELLIKGEEISMLKTDISNLKEKHKESVVVFTAEKEKLEKDYNQILLEKQKYALVADKMEEKFQDSEQLIERLTRQNRTLVEQLNTSEMGRNKLEGAIEVLEKKESSVKRPVSDFDSSIQIYKLDQKNKANEQVIHQHESKIKEHELANKILQNAVVERSYILQKVYREICKVLGQQIIKSELPDFNRDFNKSTKMILGSLSKVMDIQKKIRDETFMVQDKLAHEKSLFDMRLLKLTEKMHSFEKIIRKATENQQKLHESKSRLKAEVNKFQTENAILQQKLKSHSPEGSMRQIDREIHDLNAKLRDIHDQLLQERQGAETRVEELLFMNKTIDFELQHYKQKYETLSKKVSSDGTVQLYQQKLYERESYIRQIESKYSTLKHYVHKLKEEVGEGQKWINQALTEAELLELNRGDSLPSRSKGCKNDDVSDQKLMSKNLTEINGFTRERQATKSPFGNFSNSGISLESQQERQKYRDKDLNSLLTDSLAL